MNFVVVAESNRRQHVPSYQVCRWFANPLSSTLWQVMYLLKVSIKVYYFVVVGYLTHLIHCVSKNRTATINITTFTNCFWYRETLYSICQLNWLPYMKMFLKSTLNQLRGFYSSDLMVCVSKTGAYTLFWHNSIKNSLIFNKIAMITCVQYSALNVNVRK